MSTPSIPQYQPPTSAQLANSGMPPYIPLNPQLLESLAVSTDIQGYGLTDTMFQQQNPLLNMGQQNLQGGVLQGSQYLTGNAFNVGQAGYNANYLANNFWQNTPNASGLVNKGIKNINLGAQEMGGNYNPNAPGGANLQQTYNALTAQASGQQPIDPMVQRQLMQAGLGQAATAFGAQSLGTGTAGQANAAANLGLNVQNYIQSQRQYALSGLQGLQGLASGVQQAGQQQYGTGTSLLGQQFGALAQNQGLNQAGINSNSQLQALASSLFPRRQYGLSGASVAQLSAQNTINQNNYNQALYADQVSQNEFQANLGAEQAGLSASNTSSLLGTGASVAAAAAVAAFCGIARKVLGIRNRRWERFRHWLNYGAEAELRKLYRRNVKMLLETLSQDQLDILLPIFSGLSDKVGYVPCNA